LLPKSPRNEARIMAHSRVWVRLLFLFLADLLKNGRKASKIRDEPGDGFGRKFLILLAKEIKI